MPMHIGANLEFAKTEKMTPEQAMRAAAAIGYRHVEAYVYADVQLPINSHLTLRTESPYHHYSVRNCDTAAVCATCRDAGVEFSAVNAHCTLLLPQLGAAYLEAATEFAAAVGAPIVMSDEGPVAMEWMDLDKAFDVMCFTLEHVVAHAKSRGVLYAMELHNALTARPAYLERLLERFGPQDLGVNFDTGNSFLAGNDPVAYLDRVADRVVHVHIKDIPATMLDQRGKVTGTRVGVAAGDGEIDLPAIVSVLRRADFDGVLSVECDTLEQVRRSYGYLKELIA